MRRRPDDDVDHARAVEDFEFAGVAFAARHDRHLMSASASTDPAVFDPDRFDITVQRERGVGFGGGIHHCLGHFVARTDMGGGPAAAGPAAAARLRLDGEPRWLPLTGNTGPVALPIAFD